MWLFKHSCVLLRVPFCFSLVCRIAVEDLRIEDVNNQVVEANSLLYPCDNSKGQNCINMTVIWKKDLPVDTKMSLRGAKWIRNDYKWVLFNIEKPFKYFLEIEAFSIQSIVREYIHPPAAWPLKKHVPYRIYGLYIDGSKFPPNLPDGKWLITHSLSFANKTKVLTTVWKVLMEYV